VFSCREAISPWGIDAYNSNMPSVFEKLNLKEQREIVVLNAPDSFEGALSTLKNIQVVRRLAAVKDLTFALIFVSKQKELDKLSEAVAAKAAGDPVLWFAYPKGTSKKYSCEFNRDKGWDVLVKSGFDTVRQVAIDEDWCALRFRRTEFIKSKPR
jgi:hypothetical protein